MERTPSGRRERIREARKYLLWLLSEYDRLQEFQPDQEPIPVRNARRYFRQLTERRRMFTVVK